MGKKREDIHLGMVTYNPEGKRIISVVLTGAMFQCTKCGALKPATDFGLRFEDGVVRNQAQCSSCR